MLSGHDSSWMLRLWRRRSWNRPFASGSEHHVRRLHYCLIHCIQLMYCINWSILNFNVHFKVISHVQVIMILIVYPELDFFNIYFFVRGAIDKTFNQSTNSLSSCLHEMRNFIVWSVHWSSKYFNWYNKSWKLTILTSAYVTWRSRFIWSL